MAYKENWIVIAMITTIKLVSASILDLVCDHLVSQKVNDNCMYQTFPNSALLTEETFT